MKREIFGILFAFALVLALGFSLVMAVSVVAQDTYYVATTGSDAFGNGTETWADNDSSGDWSDGDTGPWLTIQHAIDTVSAGDTINVAAGEYAGAVLDKSVKLVGATDGTSVVTSGVPYKEGNDSHNSAFRPEADGAEIRNFTINCDVDNDFDLGIYAVGVDNVIIDSLTINSDGSVQGISNWGGSNWVITNNVITNTVASGGGGIGIFLGAKAQQQCAGNLVQYNEVNATATAETYSCPGICLCLDTRYGQYDLLDGSEDVSGNQILDNDITASGANNGVGIEVGTILGNNEADPDRTDPVKIAAIMAAAAVHDNTVQDNTVDGAYEGIYFYNVTDLIITQNTIENSVSEGIFAEHAQSGTVIQDNDFSNNNIQLTDETVDTETLDPLEIESILNNNTFDRAVAVDHQGASLLHTIWSKIQDGIDAALAGDTVNVVAGTYPESITVDRQITLQGAGSGNDPATNSVITPGSEFANLVIAASGASETERLVISGFYLSGQEHKDGIRMLGPGTIEYITLQNIAAENYEHGAQLLGTDADPLTVNDLEVIGCTFSNNDQKGFGIGANNYKSVAVDGVKFIDCEMVNNYEADLYIWSMPTTVTNLEITRGTYTGATQFGDIAILGGLDGATITDVTAGSGDASAILFYTYAPVSNVSIINPTIADVTGSSGISIYNDTGGSTADVSVSGGSISNCHRGMRVYPGTAGVSVEGVSFANNGVQIVDDAEVLDIQAILAANTFDRAVTVDHPGASLLHTIWSKIQDAVDIAIPGDTVLVNPGIYAEEITIGTADLTLQSVSKWGAAIRPTATPANHGAVIYISADGVTVDGFEIDGTTLCNNGIYGWETSALTIKNNKIHGAVNAWDGCGILLISWGNAGTVYDNLIENNEVYDTGRMGIMVMDYGGGNYTVTSGNTITGNIVHDTWTVTWDDHGGGIQINVAKNCSIANNEIYDVQNGQRGIYMYGSATGNTITSNTIRDNPIGIQLWISGEGGTPPINWGADTPASPQVRYNNIYDNGTGATSSNLEGFTPMVMDATCNWWGAIDGPSASPGSGDKVSDNVHYSPWCAIGDADPATPGYQPPTPMVWGVSTNGTIQEAIDVAGSGDTILVTAGTYEENVNVTESVTIDGQEVATLIAGIEYWTGKRGDGFRVIASDVTITGFTIVGHYGGVEQDFNNPGIIIGGTFPGDYGNLGVEGVTISNNVFMDSWSAIYVWKSSNNLIEGNEIYNMDWRAIQVYDGSNDAQIAYDPAYNDGNPANGEYSNSPVRDWQGNLLTFNPGDLIHPSQNNRIMGNEIADGQFGGIFVGAWVGGGGLWTDNTGTEITGNYIHDDNDMAMGTAFSYGSKVLSGNIIDSCGVGMWVGGDGASDTLISGNNFQNNNIQVLDEAEALVIEDVLAGNTFDRAVTVDHPTASLLHTIWSKIQDGIDVSSSGDTINVAPGTYVEAILINKPLTLRGATADVNKNGYAVPAGYAWDDTVESIIMHPDPGSGYTAIIDIYDVDNVTFEGFVVQELNADANNNTSLLRVRAQTHEVSNIFVRNNIIGPNTNFASQDGTHGRMGLYLVNNPYSDLYGITNSTFSDNKIFGCEGNGNNVFIWSSYNSYGAAGPASMAGTVIENNEIYGAHRSGIETAGGFSGLTIRNNSIYGNGGPGITGKPDLMFGNGIVMIRGSGDRENTDGYGPVNVTIEHNEIYDNEGHGIYMGPNNEGITITGNSLYNNGQDGIIADLIGNYWNPDFELDTGPHTNFAGSQDITAQFNNIYDNVGFGVRVVGTPNNGFMLDATNSWWGSRSGPTHAGNLRGTGDSVSNNVDYAPWIGARVEDSKTERVTDDTVDAKGEADTEVDVDGTAMVTVANYTDNPGTGFSGDTGKYIDVHVDDPADITELEIRLYYTDADIAGLVESFLRLRYWNGTSWLVCSDSGVNTTDIAGPPTYAGYMWARIRADTTPTLADLSGAVFAGGVEIAAPPPPPAPEKCYLIIDMLGERTLVEIDCCDNTIMEECQAYDSADLHLLGLQLDTMVLCGDCEGCDCAPRIIVMNPSGEAPALPEGMALVGDIYDFTGYKDTLMQLECQLATYFDPVATVMLHYDPELLPEGAFDPVIAFYSDAEGRWIMLPPATGIVAEPGIATGEAEYFASPFAVLVNVPPPATAEPPPVAPEPAHFVASNLSITPAEVETGETVTISLDVANDGEESGSYFVELKIKGATIDSQMVKLDGGQSRAVSFTVDAAEAGTYEVSVSGLSGSFTVTQSSLWWIYLIIAAVVIIGGVLVLRFRKRG